MVYSQVRRSVQPFDAAVHHTLIAFDPTNEAMEDSLVVQPGGCQEGSTLLAGL